jgi:hypothetical protein
MREWPLIYYFNKNFKVGRLNLRQILQLFLKLLLNSSQATSNNLNNQVQEESTINLPTVVEITIQNTQTIIPACCEEHDVAPS